MNPDGKKPVDRKKKAVYRFIPDSADKILNY